MKQASSFIEILPADMRLLVQNFVKFGQHLAKNSAKFWQTLRKFCQKAARCSATFDELFILENGAKECIVEILTRAFQRDPTSIYLQNLASLQPRIPKHFLKLETSASQPASQPAISVFPAYFQISLRLNLQSSTFLIPSHSQFPNYCPIFN